MESSQNGSSKHWSGTFQRLRAECIVLSIVLVAYTQLDIKLTKLPLIGLEFARPLPKGPILAFLYVFFIYFLGAWIVRYYRESSELLAEKTRLDSLIESIQQGRNYAGWFSIKGAKSLQSTLEQIPQTLEDLRNSAKIFNDLTSVDIPTELLPARARIVDAPDPGKAIEQSLERMRFTVSETTARFRGVETHMASVSKDITENLVSKLGSFDNTLKEWNAVLKAELKQLRIMRSSMYHDLVLFGFHAPLVLSVAMFLYSLPQGSVDIRPSIVKLEDCLANPRPACVMRNGSSIDANTIFNLPPPDLVSP